MYFLKIDHVRLDHMIFVSSIIQELVSSAKFMAPLSLVLPNWVYFALKFFAYNKHVKMCGFVS